MKKVAASVCFLAAALVARVMLTAFRTDVIIAGGAAFYRSVSMILTIVVLAAGVVTLITATVSISKQSAQKKETRKAAAEQAAAREEAESKTAVLSAKKELKPQDLRELIENDSEAVRDGFAAVYAKCLSQMQEIAECREKLSEILETNGASSLSDSEDVMKQAEQSVLKNVRKAINLRSVAEVGDIKAKQAAAAQAQEKLKLNDEKIDKSKQFLYAITDYLNRQGDEPEGIDMIDVYRSALIGAVKEDK